MEWQILELVLRGGVVKQDTAVHIRMTTARIVLKYFAPFFWLLYFVWMFKFYKTYRLRSVAKKWHATPRNRSQVARTDTAVPRLLYHCARFPSKPLQADYVDSIH